VTEVPTPHIPPEPGAKLHDRRGALALAILGLAGLGVSSWYSFTEMEFPDMWLVTMVMGFSFALLIAAALRGGRGRPFETGPVQVSFHKEVGGYAHYKVLQFVALAIDAAICAAVAGAIVMFLEDALPRTSGGWYEWATDSNKDFLKGMDLWRAAFSVVGTSDAHIILGPMLATAVCALYIFVPAAWWGATPGMLICGLRWLRTKDGQRVGALHAFLRFLAMGIFAAPQAAIMVLGTMFGVSRVRVYPGGKRYRNKTILYATWKSRRTIADMVCRTETLRPATYT
jgi:uncharacterized RDD family membrane protein YckC